MAKKARVTASGLSPKFGEKIPGNSHPFGSVGICTFPLSIGRETGRGLERVMAELASGLGVLGQTYEVYDRGIIRNELAAIGQSVRFLQELHNRHHDAWFAAYPVAGIFPILAGKRPVITGVYDLIPFLSRGFDNAPKYWIKRRCIAYSCRNSDGLIVPFSSTARQVVNLFGVPEDRIEVISIGLDHDQFFCDAGIEKRHLRIGFLGEAKRSKGLDTAILAFAQVARELSGAFLSIASGGNEIEEMKSLARREIPEGRYEFVGFVPDSGLRRFYSELDLFLFPSRYGFGMSPVESMACGTPAVVARTLDAMDFFDNELCLVNPGRPKELAERIILLLTNRNLYDELRDWGFAQVRTLSWTRMAEQYLAFWNRIVVKANVSDRRLRRG